MIFIINNNSYMNQEKPLNNLELEKSTSRRSRKDQQGRDFQCGCGKRYLSYPALYTHIKTKHDGRQPEGTQKTTTALIGKRTKGKTQDQNLKGLTNYLDKDDLKLLAELDQNHLGSVSLPLRFKKQTIPKEIYQNYQNLIKHPDMVLSKNSNIDLLLAVYLLNLGQYVNEKLYDHYLLFAKLLRNCYFEHGEDVFKNCFSNRQSQTFIESFSPGEVQYVPIICDCMLRYYIPSTKQYKDINLSLMQLMLSDFCGWLFKKKYTNIKVTLKKEYRLETKPTPLHKQRYSNNGNNSSKDKEQSYSQSNKKQKQEEDQQNSEDMSQDQIVQQKNLSGSPEVGQTEKIQQSPHQEVINQQNYVDQSKEKIIMRSEQVSIPPQKQDIQQIDCVAEQNSVNHQQRLIDPQKASELQQIASNNLEPQQSKE